MRIGENARIWPMPGRCRASFSSILRTRNRSSRLKVSGNGAGLSLTIFLHLHTTRRQGSLRLSATHFERHGLHTVRARSGCWRRRVASRSSIRRPHSRAPKCQPSRRTIGLRKFPARSTTACLRGCSPQQTVRPRTKSITDWRTGTNLRAEQAAETKVPDFCVIGLVKQDVLRLQIPVKDTLFVQVLNALLTFDLVVSAVFSVRCHLPARSARDRTTHVLLQKVCGQDG